MNKVLFLVIGMFFSVNLYAQETCPDVAPLLCEGSPVNGNYCCPFGDGGRTDVCCLQNDIEHACALQGDCRVDSGNGGGNSSQEVCSSIGTYEGCTNVDACVSDTELWYETDDGRQFFCNDASCDVAAQQTIDYCESRKPFGCNSSDLGTKDLLGIIAGCLVFGLILSKFRQSKK